MKVWVDAQLSPAIARWLAATQDVDAVALVDLGLRDAEDSRIFFAARQNGAVVMSKDKDFAELVFNTDRLLRSSGSPVAIHRTHGSRRSCQTLGRRSFNCCRRAKSWSRLGIARDSARPRAHS